MGDILDLVTDPQAPPVEWVKGPRFWWAYRFAPTLAAVAAVLLLIDFFRVPAASPPEWLWLTVLGVTDLGILLQFLMVRSYPSIRALGISPTQLVVDFGLVRQSYAWPEVRAVSRSLESSYSRYGVLRQQRTRLSVGTGLLNRNVFTLSPAQGERLARFLRVP